MKRMTSKQIIITGVVLWLTIVFVCIAVANAAYAAPCNAYDGSVWAKSCTSQATTRKTVYRPGVSVASVKGVGPRPKRWCGWWMRTQYGGGPEYNVAWNWRKRGYASGPHVGAVVVWRHHVGVIVGRASNGMWIVKSGNDSNAVRTRARSVKGAIFRGGVT